MCGRFTLRTNAAAWCQQFLPQFDLSELALKIGADPVPRYNIAPTQSVVCVLQPEVGASREPAALRWGLVPSWSDDLAIGSRMINARGETVDSKPSFKRSFASRRCLVLADGYYEWQKVVDGKQPYLIHRPDDAPFAMAGLWEINRKAASEPVTTCTVITTSANPVTGQIHDRMPVTIGEQDIDRWLDPGFRDVAALKELIRPAADDTFRLTPVSRHVNNARNEDPACIEPVAID